MMFKTKSTRRLTVLVVLRDWNGSVFYEELRGKFSGLAEVKVDVVLGDDDQGRYYRLLGFRRPGMREFVLLSGFEKITGSEYATECPRAINRKKGVLKDVARAPIWRLS